MVSVKPSQRPRKNGYARNYLIPQKKAVIVDKTALAQLEKEKLAIEARLAQQQKDAEKTKWLPTMVQPKEQSTQEWCPFPKTCETGQKITSEIEFLGPGQNDTG